LLSPENGHADQATSQKDSLHNDREDMAAVHESTYADNSDRNRRRLTKRVHARHQANQRATTTSFQVEVETETEYTNSKACLKQQSHLKAHDTLWRLYKEFQHPYVAMTLFSDMNEKVQDEDKKFYIEEKKLKRNCNNLRRTCRWLVWYYQNQLTET
jgi:hypothetical protein